MTRLHLIKPEIDQGLRRYPAPPTEPRCSLEMALTAAGILILLAFGAWLVWPAIGVISDAASSRSMCPGLTPDECAAFQGGGL
ncbi:hypothetical protein [Paracoccus sp. (in: a-proteobacteria)]|uniref:hypothetical protein n=1 Tax=Paracoccus sp. TaxID=267 RepID=UPI0028AF33AC|nr:hypothetical protein [Paracoccus sp. (in: a-proteobacteria)]